MTTPPYEPSPKFISTMRAKLFAAFGSALLVLVVVWVGIQAIDRAELAQSWVDHGVRVRSRVRDVIEALLEAQVAQTSYLALGNTYPLEDAHSVRDRATQALAALDRLTADNREQNAKIRSISNILAENLDELEESLRLAEAGKRIEMLDFVRKHQDRVAFRKLRGALDDVRDREARLIVDRRAIAQDRTQTTRVLLLVGGSLAFILATFVIVRIRASFREIESAHATIAEQAEQLSERTTQLERSVKELDQFAYVASHDLKAPLRAIASLASWISEDAGDRLDEEGQEHLRLMISRVERMDALVSGILAYSRAGRAALEVVEIDVEALLHEVIELLSPPEGMTVAIEGELAPIRAPRVPLQQVWMNLLSNAIKHGKKDGGRVVAGARPGAEGPIYFVRDDGPGIDPQFHERIFALFQTLEARDRVEGTGIGLAVVKKLVEQQGGRVWVESELGKGTTFLFTFPSAPASAPGGTPPKRRRNPFLTLTGARSARQPD
ncbi:MAG: CHASE3 domain-containing protein [Myxococcales bacterium]|nr:CHASE3 domain-containing protein [Myxococcales bacterium]MCB9732009.1 CHASE3 domain-containing protein [Deltaproteobacteria bacterium]